MAHAHKVTRLLCVAAAAALTACGGASSPVAPPPTRGEVLAVQGGVWRGSFGALSCSGSLCQSSPEPFVLRLNGAGAGVLQIDTGVFGSAPPVAIDLTAASSTSSVLLTGTTAAQSSPAMTVRLELTDVGEVLAGTLHYDLTRNSGTASKDARILFASRDTTAYGARFQGRWLGFATRTECTGCTGTAFDAVLGNAATVAMLLSQSGPSVTGTFNGVTISGTATVTSFAATGRYEIPASQCRRGFDSGTTCLIELETSVSVDALDRLRGTVTYRVEGVDDGNRPFALSGKGDLAGVVRWPFLF